jgi:hypothetical protein
MGNGEWGGDEWIRWWGGMRRNRMGRDRNNRRVKEDCTDLICDGVGEKRNQEVDWRLRVE